MKKILSITVLVALVATGCTAGTGNDKTITKGGSATVRCV